MRTTKELIVDFQAATFDKQRAVICEQIWKQAPKYEREKVLRSSPNFIGPQYRGSYVSEVLANGGVVDPPTPYWVNDAITFLAAGTSADFFWEQTTDAVPHPMAVNTALKLYREAYERATKKRTSVESVAAQVLVEYNARPLLVRLPGGRFVRKNKQQRPQPVTQVPVVRVTAPSRAASPPTDWQVVRDAVTALVEHKLQGTEPALREQMWRRFETGLKVLLDEWSNALKNAVESEKKTRSVTLATMHKHVKQACATLMLDPPKCGHPVDLRKANKQKKMLAQQYHPDASGTDETRDAYETVMAAYGVCESYNLQVGVEHPEFTVHQGGKS